MNENIDTGDSVVRELALALEALTRCGFCYGKYVLITGSDRMSIMCAAVARNCGAAGVLLSVEDSGQFEKIKKYGFDCCVTGAELRDTLANFSGGHRFDIVLETSGSFRGYEDALLAAKRGAIIGILSELKTPYTCLIKDSVRSQIRFIGVNQYSERSEKAARGLLKDNRVQEVLELAMQGGRA
jgi:threonine dehydrogenase-like Zn-dependent dehydrogenase